MSTSKLSPERAREIIDAYNECLTEGFKSSGLPSALTECGKRLNPPRRISGYYLDRIDSLYHLKPDWKLYRPRKGDNVEAVKVTSEAPVTKIVIEPVYHISEMAADGKGKTFVCAIGDAHDGPFLAKDRFRWMGRYIREMKHDCVVQIGDWASLDSLCRFEPNETLLGKQKPTYEQDMSSLKLSMGEFSDGLGNYKVDRHITMGNHEDRVLSFIDRTPEIVGALAQTPHSIYGDYGWTYSPYGAFHFVGGVGLTHIPWTRMGKPFGGENSENQIGQRTIFDVVKGHDHRRVTKVFPKLDGRQITVISLGCALPDAHIEKYAQHSLTGWSYGLYNLTIENGHIQKDSWMPMAELEERYG